MTLPRARPAIGRWVADIVKSWDTTQITDKLETEIGTDLQYIRLNGAIVGGFSWPCASCGGLTPRSMHPCQCSRCVLSGGCPSERPRKS
jgi:hypothetical protein